MKKVVPVAALLIVIMGAFAINYADEGAKIKSGLELAVVSLDSDRVERVNKALAWGLPPSDILGMPEYLYLVERLGEISRAFPVGAKWSYIIGPVMKGDNAILTVLTVEPFDGKSETLPGFEYDVSPYPAMREAVAGEKRIVVSGIVFDSTYKIWTRSGFIKIENSTGDTVGVLGVDLDMRGMAHRSISSVFLTIAYSAAFLVVCFIAFGWYVPERKRKR